MNETVEEKEEVEGTGTKVKCLNNLNSSRKTVLWGERGT